MKINEFDSTTFRAVEKIGRPNLLKTALIKAVETGNIFSVPAYTTTKNKTSSEQIQSSKAIQIMREIASKWSYAYHEGETLEIVFIPPKMKVHFATKKLQKD